MYQKDAYIHSTLIQLVGFNDIKTNGLLNGKDLEKYKEICRNININPFAIYYRRLALTDKGIIMLGYPSININEKRDLLKNEIKKNNIVHSTILRFTDKLTKEEINTLSQIIQEFENHFLLDVYISKLTLGYGS